MKPNFAIINWIAIVLTLFFTQCHGCEQSGCERVGQIINAKR